MSESKLEVVLFAEEQVVAAGIRAILAEAGDEFEVIGCFATHSETVQKVARLKPKIILYCMPAQVGLAAVQEVRDSAPASALILLVRDFPAELGRQALDMGVRGVLSTASRAETVCECLRLSASGHPWVDGQLSAELLNAHPVSLSPRQSELLGLLLRGLKNKEIATEMGLSVATVKAYLAILFEKVGAKDRFELALFGLKNLTRRRESAQLDRSHPPRLNSLMPQRNPRNRALG